MHLFISDNSFQTYMPIPAFDEKHQNETGAYKGIPKFCNLNKDDSEVWTNGTEAVGSILFPLP